MWRMLIRGYILQQYHCKHPTFSRFLLLYTHLTWIQFIPSKLLRRLPTIQWYVGNQSITVFPQWMVWMPEWLPSVSQPGASWQDWNRHPFSPIGDSHIKGPWSDNMLCGLWVMQSVKLQLSLTSTLEHQSEKLPSTSCPKRWQQEVISHRELSCYELFICISHSVCL